MADLPPLLSMRFGRPDVARLLEDAGVGDRKLPALEDLPADPDEPVADAKPLGEALAGKHIAVDAPAAFGPDEQAARVRVSFL